MFVRLYCGVHRAVGIPLVRLSDALGKRDGTAEIPFISFSSWEGMGEQRPAPCPAHGTLSLQRLVIVLPSTLSPA